MEVSKHCSQTPFTLLPKLLSTPKSYHLHILQLSIFAILEIKPEKKLMYLLILFLKTFYTLTFL